MAALAASLRVLKDKEKIKILLLSHQGSIQAWALFLIIAFGVYHLFSDGDFSFLLTLSSLIGTFTFIMIIYKVEAFQSCKGVSLKMIECFVLLLFARLCSIIFFEGYLPYDKSGDWLYQLTEALSFCFAGTIVFLCRVRHKTTYDQENDSFNHFFLILPTFILAVVLHPSLNGFTPTDISWAFASYLEAVAVLPQLFMFQKEGKVEPFTTHFLAGQACARVFSFIFWLSSHSELNGPSNSINSYVGPWMIIMQVVQLIVMGDFIYHYLRCLTKGVPVEYLLAESV